MMRPKTKIKFFLLLCALFNLSGTFVWSASAPSSTASFVVAQPKKDKRSKNRLREDLVERLRDVLSQSAVLVGVVGDRLASQARLPHTRHESELLRFVSVVQRRCIDGIEQVIDNGAVCKKASRETLRHECACAHQLHDQLTTVTKQARDLSKTSKFSQAVTRVQSWYATTMKTCQVI